MVEQILYLGKKEIGKCTSVILEDVSSTNILLFKDSNNNNVKIKKETNLQLLKEIFSFEGIKNDKDVKCKTNMVGNCLMIYLSPEIFKELNNFINY